MSEHRHIFGTGESVVVNDKTVYVAPCDGADCDAIEIGTEYEVVAVVDAHGVARSR